MNYQVPPIGGFDFPYFLPIFFVFAVLIFLVKLMQLAIWLSNRRNRSPEETSTSETEVPPDV